MVVLAFVYLIFSNVDPSFACVSDGGDMFRHLEDGLEPCMDTSFCLPSHPGSHVRPGTRQPVEL